jgi:predicted ATPase
MHNPTWHVITGGPSTGKTTLQQELYKLGYATLDEAARLVIDDAIALGTEVEDLRDDEKRFQDDVVRRRIVMEDALAAKYPADDMVILDRGMQDSLAYYRYYNFTIEPWIMDLMKDASYGKVFLMEPLGFTKQDYARTEVRDFNDHITDMLLDAYKEYGMEAVIVPPVSVAERLEIVLEHLKNWQSQVS